MATRVEVMELLKNAAMRYGQEAFAVYEALSRWIGSRVDTMFIGEVDMTTNQTGAQATPAATNVVAVEVNSPAAATNGSNVYLFDVAAGSITLGTTGPIAGIRVPAAGRIVMPFFAFESSQFGKRIATQWSLANTTPTSLSAQPAAADRVTARVITIGVA